MDERDGVLTAPPQLRRVVMGELLAKGIAPREVAATVIPRREPGRPNKVLDRRAERWVADCPECPGAEVVPSAGSFLCGSCGAQCEIDWEGI